MTDDTLTHEQFLQRLEGLLGFIGPGPVDHNQIWQAVYRLLQPTTTQVEPLQLRDEFAMAALNGFCANPEMKRGEIPAEAAHLISVSAYLLADAMLAAREEHGGS